MEPKSTFPEYACLVEDCVCLFNAWNTARRHMRSCGLVEKPVLNVSHAKAKKLLLEDPQLPVERTKIPMALDVTEEQLVDCVRAFYASGSSTSSYRRHVISRAIRPRFGNCEFNKLVLDLLLNSPLDMA